MLFLTIQIFILFSPTESKSDENFNTWLSSYKEFAIDEGVSKKTVEATFKNVKFLEQVIIYDRKQPEFFEDTITYVKKRATPKKVKEARKLLKKNNQLFNEIENKFNVDKEIPY